jgi:hypothetical protein
VPRTSAFVAFVVAVLATSVAIWTGTTLVKGCSDAFALRGVAVVDASILDIDRQIVTAGDGTQELVFVTYTYQFEGRRFESRTQRLKLFGDNKELHETLEGALKKNETIPCYVSRANPSLSVFSLEFSIPLFFLHSLFPIAFGSIAVLCTWSLYRSWRSKTVRRTNA